MDLFGAEYVIEHIAYEHKRKIETDTYKVFVTDVLKAIAEQYGIGVNSRFVDLISKPAVEDERTGDEIALEVIRKLGLKGRTSGESTGLSSEDIA